MAVVIRMKRTGRRRRSCYRISVADRAFPRDGRTLETLGVYDPASPKEELRLTLNTEAARRWLTRGAVPSHTVRSILKREGVYEDFPLPKKRKRTGRLKRTSTGTRNQAAKKVREERKATRRTERVAVRRAAVKAAAAAASESDTE
ncbi:MAG: 30S ribosomal protein S16 [Planctomycetes bacterium]|jgi:small subunit ribosomal protein S16|nr:30S ribosomal protein S16 [Planctomycetota bacterium]